MVVELTSFPVRDGSLLSGSQKRLLEETFPEPEYGWRQFRRNVLRAVADRFGASGVREGKKTFKLVMESPEVPVDVVVAVRYLKYTEYSGRRSYQYIEGMGLYLPTEKRWIVNYPHIHRRNGVAKEKATKWRFRPCIRMFKNARARLVDEGRLAADTARSYQIECLLYNVPDLRGAWTGTVAGSYSGFEENQEVTVTIEQTWTKLAVRLNAAESRSWSVTASVLAKAPEGLVLTYLFDNEPRAEAARTMQRFRGTTVLVETAPGQLEGHYYTGRGRETHGSLKLRRLLHD